MLSGSLLTRKTTDINRLNLAQRDTWCIVERLALLQNGWIGDSTSGLRADLSTCHSTLQCPSSALVPLQLRLVPRWNHFPGSSSKTGAKPSSSSMCSSYMLVGGVWVLIQIYRLIHVRYTSKIHVKDCPYVLVNRPNKPVGHSEDGCRNRLLSNFAFSFAELSCFLHLKNFAFAKSKLLCFGVYFVWWLWGARRASDGVGWVTW